MSKAIGTVHVLTANRLGDGAVVFLDSDGVWVTGLEGAAVARSPEETRDLETRGAFDLARNLVVEPYLVEMREAAGALMPVRQRERVRLGGPSMLADVPGYVAPRDSPPLAASGERGKGAHFNEAA
jgi:hypothetical protein